MAAKDQPGPIDVANACSTAAIKSDDAISGRWYYSEKYGRILCCGSTSRQDWVNAFAIRKNDRTIMKYISEATLTESVDQHWPPEEGVNACAADLDDAIVQKQLQFVEWLKQNGMYSEYASANEMRKMQSVWMKCQEEFIADISQSHDDATHGYLAAERGSDDELRYHGAVVALVELLEAFDTGDTSQ